MSEEIRPTDETIEQWKSRFPVYRITLGGNEYYYRQIYRAEYKNIANTIGSGGAFGPTPDTNFSYEEQVAQTCTLFPKLGIEEIAATPAGVVTRLAELILEASGFDEIARPEML